MAHSFRKMKSTLLLPILALFLYSCGNCEKYENETYLEEDSLTWNSPRIANIGATLENLKLNRLELSNETAYRMFYHEAFEENERFIQLSKTDSGFELSTITFQMTHVDNKFGASLLNSAKLKISEAQWNEFENKIYEAKFWTLPKPMNERGLDGRTIILEGSRPEAHKCNKRTYQLICRWSPEPGPLREAVELLLSYAKRLNEP
jgi:hypothetical protein